MGRSIFYQAAFGRRFPLSYLFFEHLGAAIEAHAQDPTPEVLEKFIRDSLLQCLDMEEVSVDDLAYVATRLTEVQKEAAAPAAPPPSKKGFATSYAAWVSKLSPASVCLVLADFNYEKARTLFCDVDKDDVSQLSEVWVARSWEVFRVQYECAIYGFGGGYSDETNEIDVAAQDHTQGVRIDPRALAAVKF